jgi:hypothetical protein
VALKQIREFALGRPGVLEPEHRMAADGAALDLQRMPAERQQRHCEWFAARTQRRDGALHGGGFAAF